MGRDATLLAPEEESAGSTLGAMEQPFLKRVVLKDYKSIGACDVRLGSLVFLVGPNGSGKSNFVDALRFVADALRTSLDHAMRERGGIKEVRRRSTGHPRHFGMRLEFALRTGESGHYAFRIGARERGGYEVQNEECVVHFPESLGPGASFHVRSGRVSSTAQAPPPAQADRLYLVTASGLPEFRGVYDAFSRMGFYNLNPDHLRALQKPDQGDLLARDGGNIASVIDQMEKRKDPAKARIQEYLEKVVPGVQGVAHKDVGGMETLEFRQVVPGAKAPWRFPAASMSDGTLRALGILVALLQSRNGDRSDVSLVAIEEPEVALHPAAAGVVLDALLEARRSTQVVVTSHSPDLLDDERLDTDSILAVMAREGETLIAPLDEVGRKALREHLYTAGELLRLNQLVPDPVAIEKLTATQLRLFDDARG
jgi:predicted ATPase